MVTEEHPNVALLKQLDITNLDGSAEVLAEDFVWHYFNPSLPDLEGDYVGLNEFRGFFESLAKQTNGTFRVKPIAVTPVGDELLVVQTQNTLVLEAQQIEIDVVVVWRIVDGRIAEGWDIPSAHVARITNL